MPLFHTVTDLAADSDVLRRRAYGVIETAGGKLAAIHLRPWPKVGSLVEAWWHGHTLHRRTVGDRCWLYYNQPLSCPNFLALTYLVSSRDATLGTMCRALAVLDEIAYLKRTDAIVCEAASTRLTDRVLRRYGWAQHLPDSSRRHFIKRFYGVFPKTSHTRSDIRQNAGILANSATA